MSEFDDWFRQEQGKPYDSMYSMARAAWDAAIEAACCLCDEVSGKSDSEAATCEDYALDQVISEGIAAHKCGQEIRTLLSDYSQDREGVA